MVSRDEWIKVMEPALRSAFTFPPLMVDTLFRAKASFSLKPGSINEVSLHKRTGRGCIGWCGLVDIYGAFEAIDLLRRFAPGREDFLTCETCKAICCTAIEASYA